MQPLSLEEMVAKKEQEKLIQSKVGRALASELAWRVAARALRLAKNALQLACRVSQRCYVS